MQFTRLVVLPGWLQRAVNDRPYTAMCFVYGFSGRFVGDAYRRPVRFARYIALSGWLQRAAYMPPLQPTRNIVIPAKPRAGHTPPLPRHDFLLPHKKMCPHSGHTKSKLYTLNS